MHSLPEILITFEDRQRLSELIAAELAAGRYEAVTFLANEINRARTVPAALIPPTCMTLNAHGRYLDERSGLVREGALVLPGQQRASLNMVSVLSDLGAALLGLSVGQRMTWRCRFWGDRSIRLLEVLHQPARARGQAPPDDEWDAVQDGGSAPDGRGATKPCG